MDGEENGGETEKKDKENKQKKKVGNLGWNRNKYMKSN